MAYDFKKENRRLLPQLQHRGEGAGKKIVRYLIGCALERNITKIYLETSPCGKALYEAAGFSEMRDMMLLTYGK